MKYSLEVEAASPVSTIASTIATLAPPPPPPKSVPPMAAKGVLPPVTLVSIEQNFILISTHLKNNFIPNQLRFVFLHLLPLSTSDDDVPVVVAAKCPFDADEHLDDDCSVAKRII